MTAEGTPRNDAGEAPKAEFAAEKVAAAGKAPAERDGEDVGGPFVIVNGDSDGLSDRGSDLGKPHDEDSPSEDYEVLGSNAAPDAPMGGDHGAAVGEEGASVAAPGVSSADGCDRPAEDPKVGAHESKGEPSADLVTAEVVQQETASGVQGEADAILAVGRDHAVAATDSDAPAVDSEISAKEGNADDNAATDVSELVAHKAATAEQNAEDTAMESSGYDGALTKTESGSATMNPEVHVDDNNNEQTAATEVDPVDQSTGGPDALIASGHHSAETKADFEVASEIKSRDDELKSEKNAIEINLAEQVNACGEKDSEDATETNGHTYVALSSEIRANKTEGQESDQHEEGEPLTESEVKSVTADKDLTYSVEDSTEENVDEDVHSCVKVCADADASGKIESVTEKLEGEATCVIDQVEEKMDKDGEGCSCDDLTAGVASNKEVELPAANGMNEAVPHVDELEKTTVATSKETVQDDDLAKDGETYPSAETSQENNSEAEIAQVDETAAEPDLKSDSRVEANIAAPLHSQQNCDSAVETVGCEQLEASDIGQLKEFGSGEGEESIQKIEKEVSDNVPSQEVAASSASTFHNETQSTELVDGGSFKQSRAISTEIESCYCEHTGENISREISDITAGQLVSDTSLKHGSTGVGEAELSSVTGDKSQGRSSESIIEQDEPAILNADELVVADAENSASGYESAGTDKVGDISNMDDSGDIAGENKVHADQSETCNASTVCDVAEDVASENLEALEPLSVDRSVLAEHKIDDKHAPDEEAKIVQNSSELHGDLDKNNMGDAEIVSQQKIYVIKVPKFNCEDLWAKIQDAHANLDKLTQERDTINIRKQKQKSVCSQLRQKFEAARQEEREARAAHGDKKNDLNSIRSAIGKLNQEKSIEEIEEMIAVKEKTMQHETISLKEEKLLIKEINDLKAQRKQLRSNMGPKAEINEAFDQKEDIHERHKTLKKDSDALFTNLKSLEENTRRIQKSLQDEKIALRKLDEEHQTANEKRQKAYHYWNALKQEPGKKNQYFSMYKNVQGKAREHLASGNLRELQLCCNYQVDRVMEIWNKDDDFRKEYVEANKVSTLKRFWTYDGRSLGPNEERPVIPSRRPNNPSSSLTISSPNVITTTAVPAPAPVVVSVKEDQFPVLPSPDISEHKKSKASGTSAHNEKVTVTVSETEIKEAEKEKARLMEEELELAKKAEELAHIEEKKREEKAAAEKERLRLEQKAKAKEAEERKRRKAEKDKERAEFKARKEAEIKQKKKAKKDKKKGLADSSDNVDGHATAPPTADTDSNTSDNPRETELPQPTAPKRISRPAAAIKQLNRLQPMPAPLRNRGKRKMRQYILIAAAVLSVLALFMVGNYLPRLKSLHS